MILVAGGTGRLGRRLVSRLISRGEKVRVLSRTALPAFTKENSVDTIQGDLRDSESLKRAMQGVDRVVAAAHGFIGPPGITPMTVDWEGNRNLIEAAEAAGVQQFVLLSVVGAALDHPMELFAMKARAEAALRASSLPWTIVRATAFMETWLALIGEPLIKTGKTRVFGRGRNPINFVSIEDVADAVEPALFDPQMRQKVIEVGGPENLTWLDFTRTIQEVTGRPGKVARVPRPVLRAMSVTMRPVNPALARQVSAALVMDTRDMRSGDTAGGSALRRTGRLRLADVVRRDYMGASIGQPVQTPS